ncbi:MAG: MerR family transcriptional regulator [Alphaproteobacteria bacterium]|nr:MerR family transcriptional regulator [Alphaproteobacteria bacterium]
MFKESTTPMPRAKKPPSVFADAPTAIAKRFGVSAKALRVYERLGLIRPARTASGWRSYGQAEIERLAAIVALKQMGLPLKRIGTLLTGNGDLAAVLALQEAALEETKASTAEALALVRAARRRLADNAALSPDELATLIRRSKMTNVTWTPKMEAMAQKHYTPEQLQDLRARNFSAEDQTRVAAAWDAVYSDIDALGSQADPASDKALAIGRRAYALIAEFTQGDPALFKAAGAMKTDMMQDPETVKQMPGKVAHFQFMGRIFAELKKRGEIASS